MVTEFKKEILTDPNIAIHCETEEQAISLLEWASMNGKTWSSGASFIGMSNWEVLREETTYMVNIGEYCEKEFYEERGKKVLTYNQALAEEKEPRKGQIALLDDAYSIIKATMYGCGDSVQGSCFVGDCGGCKMHEWVKQYNAFKNGEVE